MSSAANARVEIVGSHVDRHQHGVAAATMEFGSEHLRRAHLLDRIADDAEQARTSGDKPDRVGAFLRHQVPSSSPSSRAADRNAGRNFVSISLTETREDCVPMLSAATTLPEGSVTGTAIERNPISSS